MKRIKENLAVLALALLEALVGILLLISPVSFTTGIIIAAGVLLAVGGIVGIVKYFGADVVTAQREQRLVRGLLALMMGVFCITQSAWFISAFPVLTALYGAAMLVAGLYKVQRTADMLRQKKEGWQWAAASAALALGFALIILLNPFATTQLLWMFTAITLIVEAALDGVFVVKHMLKARNA